MKTFGLVLFAIVHGYFAAWLAVWMLFHPRHPRYLWGRRIPFTPGLLPASRGNLEESIADAVASQLLRPEVLEESAVRQGIPRVIRGALPEQIDHLGADPDFQEILSQGVSDAVRDFLRSKNGVRQEITEKALIVAGKTFGFSWDSILEPLWRQIEEAVEKIVRTQKFRQAMERGVQRLAEDLRRDESPVSMKVEDLSGKILGRGIAALDLKNVIRERLASFTNEELENLVQKTAGGQLQSIKNVAAVIGVLFGLISLVLFG